ncbi:MAG: hypothetical protein LBL27_02065, partial [Coriobacteriales bacterium]|nr:hypothetical protein [Coriobacteriales bacterium]
MIKQRVQRMALRGGSTLVWVMVVILVLVVVLGIGLTATSSRFGLSVTRHEQQQAYYTALSSTNTIADWLTTSTADNAKKEKAEKLLGTIPGPGDNPNNIDITEDGLPAEVGTCTVNLRYVDSKKSTLKIASTAVFAGVSETVSLTLTREEASGYSPGADLAVSNYDGTKYDKRADELKAIKSTGIVAIYDSNEKDNTGYNETDKTLLNSYIKTTTSTYEARWTNSDLTKKPSTTDSGNSSETNNSNVLGTETYPANSSSSSNNKNDTRRFMVPINGRITIDPLERDGHEGSASSPHSSATSGDNTRVVGLAISNTAGKNVLFRLASGAASTSPGLLNKTGTFYDWSAKRYASLITLNFTDNAKSTEANNTENLKYTVPGRSQETYPWHPDKWASMDFLVRSNDSVTTNLVLGPFAHKYQIAL